MISIIALSLYYSYETSNETFFAKQIEDVSGVKLQATSNQGEPITLVPLELAPKNGNIIGLIVIPKDNDIRCPTSHSSRPRASVAEFIVTLFQPVMLNL